MSTLTEAIEAFAQRHHLGGRTIGKHSTEGPVRVGCSHLSLISYAACSPNTAATIDASDVKVEITINGTPVTFRSAA